MQATGPFVDEWKKAFGDISKEVEEVEIGPALSMAGFAIKDEAELVSRDRVSYSYRTRLMLDAVAIDENRLTCL